MLVGREGTKCALRISRDNIPFTVYLIREQPVNLIRDKPLDSSHGTWSQTASDASPDRERETETERDTHTRVEAPRSLTGTNSQKSALS